MDEYEKLLESLAEEVRKRRAMSWEELLKWGEEHGVGPVTLSLLVEELERKGLVEASAELELVDEHLEIALPKRITAKDARAAAAQQRAAVAAAARRRHTRAVAGRQDTLLKFLAGGEEEVEREEAERAVAAETRVAEVEPRAAVKAPSEDESFVIALHYLRKYWSVGELRFLMDLKNLGVSSPESVLRRLVEEGLVTLVEPGVVNAKRPEIEKRIRELGEAAPSKSLADLLEAS